MMVNKKKYTHMEKGQAADRNCIRRQRLLTYSAWFKERYNAGYITYILQTFRNARFLDAINPVLQSLRVAPHVTLFSLWLPS